jgi:hypothetical protein
MSTFAGPKTASSVGFCVDFSNLKSISGTTLTDLSANQIPIVLTNSGDGTLSITNGYAVFSPATLTGSATYYTISNSYFNDIKNEMTLETCMYPTSNFSGAGGGTNYVRGVSPRTSETASPLGFSIAEPGITSETNTTAGWLTGYSSTALAGLNKWNYVTQTVSVTDNSFKTYINGYLTNTISLTGATPNGGNGILIGRGFFGGVANYVGQVSFVRVYNRALTAEEVLINFNAARSRYGL